MLDPLIQALRTRKKIRGPLAGLHYRLWRATGLSGIQAFRPELGPLAETARRTAPADLAARNGRRILFFSFRGWNTHVVSSALLAHALRLRGADVRFFTCGGRLPVCDISSHVLAPPMPCNLCAPYVMRVAETLKIPCGEMADYVTPSERAAIRRSVNALKATEYETFEMDGLPVGRLVRASLQWFMLAGSPQNDPETMEMYRRFLISGAETALAGGRLLDAMKPEQLVLLNGIFFAERLTIEQARRRGIPFVTHEGGFMPGTFVYTRQSFAPHLDLSEFWPRYRSRPLTDVENQLLDDLLRARMEGKRDVGQYYPDMQADSERILTELRLDPSRPIVSLFTNVDWDTAAFAAGAAFDSMESWLAHTVGRFAADPSRQLVIRVHPAEVRLPFLPPREPALLMLQRHFPELPANVRVIPPESPISSYTLMDLSTAAVVYTSTVGMEMSLKGKPVVVAGRSYYADRGFTFDARSPAEFDELLDRVLGSGALPREQVELARRYAFLFFFRFQIRFPVISVTGRKLDINMETLDELRPGVHREIDLLCDAFLEGKPFLNEAEF